MIELIATKLKVDALIVMVVLIVAGIGAVLTSYAVTYHRGKNEGERIEQERQAAVMAAKNRDLRALNQRLVLTLAKSAAEREVAVAAALATVVPAWTQTTIANAENCGIPKKARDEVNRIR